MNIIITALGIVILLGGLYSISSSKSSIDKTLVIKALIFQTVLAFLLVKFPLGKNLIMIISEGVTKVLSYGYEGLSFVFGSLAIDTNPTGSIFGIQVLGIIIFVSALTSGLYYLGIIGFIVKVVGGIIQKILGTSKVESFVAVANMFLGQTESPILVSKYISSMNESELMLLLVSGMGSISATILMGYSSLGIPMEYLLIACAMVPLSSIVVSKIICPLEDSKDKIEDIVIDNKGNNRNLISAISEGAMNGLNMVLAIGASLIAIISIVALINGFLGIFGLSLEKILSIVFAPIGFLMGIGKENVFVASQLLGSKMVLNEFVAFSELGKIIQTLDYRTGLMLSISLTSFANLSSIAICTLGISVFAPGRKSDISRLASKAMIGGFFVSILSALIVGIIIW